MALKSKLSREEFEKLPEAIKEHYAASGEGYALDTDAGSEYKSKVDEFRINNVALMKEREALKDRVKQFEGIDPEAARTAAARLIEIEEQGLKDDNKIDELVEKRVERMSADFKNKYGALEERNVELEQRTSVTEKQLHTKMVESGIAGAIVAVGSVRKGALPDIMARAHSVWKLDDNLELVAMNGDQPIIGADGKSPLTPEEYASALLQDAPFFFEGSSGAGGKGGTAADAGAGGKSVAAGDKVAFGANLEAIAKGEVQVL